jgi:hypothetical protein
MLHIAEKLSVFCTAVEQHDSEGIAVRFLLVAAATL